MTKARMVTSTNPRKIPLPDDEMNLHVDDTPPGTMALIANEPQSNYPEAIEIYDSGCTKHMTSYHHCLSNFQSITLKNVGAASQVTFAATGTGDMIIKVPNDGEINEIKLCGVLYAPNLRCTLISIGRIDDTGYSSIFKGGKCIIRN